MKQICIIILNYITYEMTLNLVKSIREAGFTEDIIVVDNHSENASFHELLQASKAYNITVLQSEKNGGYAYGNNLGLKHALKMGYISALIINNDVEIPEIPSLYKMYDLLETDKNIACVCPRILDNSHSEIAQRVSRPNCLDYSLKIMGYESALLKNTLNKKDDFRIYRPHGCCMLLSLEAMKTVNFMDEKTFLYFEEDILSEKFINYGYKCYCCNEAYVIHNHSVTTSKVLKRLSKLRIYLRSANIYFKDYRGWNLFQRIPCLIVKGLSMTVK